MKKVNVKSTDKQIRVSSMGFINGIQQITKQHNYNGLDCLRICQQEQRNSQEVYLSIICYGQTQSSYHAPVPYVQSRGHVQ